tara:strand:- start:996 stop:1655 length:660 start_codon:yes stop_codon:yes gene_type:complete
MSLLLFIISMFVYAQEPASEVPDAEIVVEAHKDYEVYVAPVQYHIVDESYSVSSVSIPDHMVYNYASLHANRAKVQVRYRTWEPVTMHGGVKVYNKETIKYVWDNCRYNRDYRKCSFQNSHYFVETIVTINKDEVVISMTLFDQDMQALNTSNISDKAIVRWIKQQEIIITQQQSMMGSSTTIHKPKEELPLEWRIPPQLFTNAIRQASLRLWTGVRLD